MRRQQQRQRELASLAEVCKSVNPASALELNVGGTLFSTTKETLCKHSDRCCMRSFRPKPASPQPPTILQTLISTHSVACNNPTEGTFIVTQVTRGGVLCGILDVISIPDKKERLNLASQGSCAALVLASGGTVYCAHVGDCEVHASKWQGIDPATSLGGRTLRTARHVVRVGSRERGGFVCSSRRPRQGSHVH